jgi:putative inorganic carbon (HCO3(-)) transporter
VRDIGLLTILAGLTVLALRRPWLGALGLAVFGYMQPHSYSSGFVQSFPVYEILFLATVTGALLTRDWQMPPRDWRVLILLALWLGFFVTTELSVLHYFAWPKLIEVSKVLASAFLLLILINSREKLTWLLAVSALSFSLVAFKGGFWALTQGFSDRVYGPPGSQYGDNNHFAVAVVMAIPLLMFWLRQSDHRSLRWALTAAIAFSVFAALSSWSRGALLTLGITTAVLFLGNRKQIPFALALVGAAAVAFLFLPDAWFSRMETIGGYAAEQSAQGRLFAWQRGIGYALNHPLTGAGFDGWVLVTWSRDWHNAFIEIMAEHGLIVFLLWLALILGTQFELVRVIVRRRGSAGDDWEVACASALLASLTAYCVGALFVGISYWDLLYHLIAAAIILKRLVRQRVHNAREATEHETETPVWGGGSARPDG